MENLHIPACAMYRQIGTVLVKTDEFHCGRTSFTEAHENYTKCEKCCRTRSNSQYSDCVSEKLKKCRRYRASAARSRYVNVCAAVCLLVLVGGLSPLSSAVPLRRNMENPLWGNPCDYTDDAKWPSGLPINIPSYTPDMAKSVANQARNALGKAEEFKDMLAKTLFSFDSFDKMLLGNWETKPWLSTLKFEDATKYVLPEDKARLGQCLPEDYMKEILSIIHFELPTIHKGLKMVIGALNEVHVNGLRDDLDAERALKPKFEATMNNCRQVLCTLNDVMAALPVSTIHLMDMEIPKVKEGNRLENVFIIYRDTLLYLDWLTQLMDALARQNL